MADLILVGLGEQAKAIITTARKIARNVRAIYTDDARQWGDSLLGVPITGPVRDAQGANLPAVIAYDSPQQRCRIAQQYDLLWQTIFHPSAFLNPSATIGPGTVVLEGAVIQPSVSIGRHVLISANATVAHDCAIEDFAQLGTGVDLAGYVHVGTGARLDVGAIVIPNINVGMWSWIGPRAVVVRDVPDEFHMAGVPARNIN